jgi:hypothetical protein
MLYKNILAKRRREDYGAHGRSDIAEGDSIVWIIAAFALIFFVVVALFVVWQLVAIKHQDWTHEPRARPKRRTALPE